MTWLRKPLLPHILTGVVAAWMLAVIPLAPTHAQIWSEYAMVSATLGVSDSRICIGEASRGDIGCPTYAPYVNAANGYVGIGTATPSMPLHVEGTSNALLKLLRQGDASEATYTNYLVAQDTSLTMVWYIGDASNLRRVLLTARGPVDTPYSLDFEVNSATRMRIDPQGQTAFGASVYQKTPSATWPAAGFSDTELG